MTATYSNDWENPKVFGINKEPDAATLARLERDILADCCGGRHGSSDPE